MEFFSHISEEKKVIKPSVAFVGIGWIGLNRMKALADQDIISIDSLADIRKESLDLAAQAVPKAKLFSSLQEVMNDRPAGVVIATPSALHAEQAIYALDRGASVFCQKPLARTAEETRQIVESAKKNDLLISVDFSYRYTEGMQKIYDLVQSDILGNIFSAQLVFHNAYGPDKEWFYEQNLSGGGCVIDLGIHLIDLALWILNFPDISKVSSSLFSNGELLKKPDSRIEDFARINIETEVGHSINIDCSWNLQAGQDALIEATFYGTRGGATFRNINGSFYDFEALHFYSKTKREILASPPDDWGGRASAEWARRLAVGEKFNEDSYQFIRVAEIIDQVYNRM